jgi:AmiR/NasT family two-component response regulator
VELLRKLGHWVDVDVTQFADVARERLDAAILEVSCLSAHEVESIAAGAVADPFPVVTTSSSASNVVIDKAKSCHTFAPLINPLCGDGLSAALHLAVDRCTEMRALRKEVVSTRQSLAERKTVEQAKEIFMRSTGSDEATAYKHMQQLACCSRRPLVEIAYRIENCLRHRNCLRHHCRQCLEFHTPTPGLSDGGIYAPVIALSAVTGASSRRGLTARTKGGYSTKLISVLETSMVRIQVRNVVEILEEIAILWNKKTLVFEGVRARLRFYLSVG